MVKKYDLLLGQCTQYSDQGMGWTVWGTNTGRDNKFFSSQKTYRLAQGAHPACWVLGFFPPGVKWVGPEVHNSHPSSHMVRNEQEYTFILPVCLCDVDRGNFTSYIYQNCDVLIINSQQAVYIPTTPSDLQQVAWLQ